MKTKTLKKDYLAPEIGMVTLASEGVLCASQQPMGFGVDDMDIIDGENSGFGWDD